QKWMIGAASFLFRIVTQPRFLLPPIESEHDRIQIEQERRTSTRTLVQSGAQTIVQPNQLPDRVRGQSLQEPAQARRIGKTLQSQQREESPVVLKDGRFAHPLETSHQHIDQRQKQIRGLEMAGGLWRQINPTAAARA